MKKLRSALVPVLILLMADCASVAKYHLNVASMQASGTEHKRRFILFPGNENTSANDPQFREYAGYINRALTSRGFVPSRSCHFCGLRNGISPIIEILESSGIGLHRCLVPLTLLQVV